MEELREEEEEEEGDSFTVQVLSFRSGSVRQNAVCVVRTNCFVIVFVFFYKMETSCKGGAEEKRTAAENGVIQRSRIKTVSEISCNFKTSPRRLTFLSSLKPPAEAVRAFHQQRVQSTA